MIQHGKWMLPGALMLALTGCEYVQDMPVLGRYMAKNVCSGLFVEGYTESELIKDYVIPLVPVIEKTWRVEVDEVAQRVSVTNSLFRNVQSTAIHRPPAGCVNLVDFDPDTLIGQAPTPYEFEPLDLAVEWPYGGAGKPSDLVSGVNYAGLEQVLDDEFDKTNGKNTTAMLVIYDDKIVAERYHESIDAKSPLKGFSMSKSLANALIGGLQNDGWISASEPTGIAAWQGDQRQDITVENLLFMESGLAFVEQAVGPNSDQGEMLYGTAPASEYAISRPSTRHPGTAYNYSSGDNLILASIGQGVLGGSSQTVYDYLQSRIFEPINVTSALMEFDANASLLSSESLFLTARDWARFIRLYMKQGEWNGEQVLPSSWVDYSLQAGQFDDRFGANIWVNKNSASFESLPEDTIAFYGALERFVIAIPSYDVIVVRIGFSHNRTLINMDEIMQRILAQLPIGASASN